MRLFRVRATGVPIFDRLAVLDASNESNSSARGLAPSMLAESDCLVSSWLIVESGDADVGLASGKWEVNSGLWALLIYEKAVD